MLPEEVKASENLPLFLSVSHALHSLPNLAPLLGAKVFLADALSRLSLRYLNGIGSKTLCGWTKARQATLVLAWGQKPSAQRAGKMAQRLGLPLLRLEDGFLRSFGTGDQFPPLSVVVDELGIYYDSTGPSALEQLLNSPVDLLAGLAEEVHRARAQILEHHLSKYNHAPDWGGDGLPRFARSDGDAGIKRVLVIDQTAGDMSVALGGASANTFAVMLTAARAENPQATVYVKTHPEVSAGRKGGYLTSTQDDKHTVVLRQAINPLSLIKHMDRVYVVTSTMGFEALLAGKPVTVFGLPWYAGWGATDDRQLCSRRTSSRNVDELFAAAYFHYTRYINPVTHQRGSIFDVMNWLVRQRQYAGLARASDVTVSPSAGRVVCVGFPAWRKYNVSAMLSLYPQRVEHVLKVEDAMKLALGAADRLVYWGGGTAGSALAGQGNDKPGVARLEDGFVRSVGLGSDLIRPMSLVLDGRGIYFDPSQPSDLEHVLCTAKFGPQELDRARWVRDFIVAQGITKYNLEPRELANWPSNGRRVVLVPGQVEDDASIRLGCTAVKTNLALLKAARHACPDAFLIFKPHPDVVSGNRAGKVSLAEVGALADHIETQLSVVSCIQACDEVHTMTSLTGFDALLRQKNVVTYGQPFYAGWGLTTDMAQGGTALARRSRHLTLDELVAGTLLRYPIYWDWELKGYTTCEAVLQRIVDQRTILEVGGGLAKLQAGYVRRQWRKLHVLIKAWGSLA